MKATEKEIRDAIEFMERLMILKSNRWRSLSDFGPIARKRRETFVNYCLRARTHFPLDHNPPRLRLRKR